MTIIIPLGSAPVVDKSLGTETDLCAVTQVIEHENPIFGKNQMGLKAQCMTHDDIPDKYGTPHGAMDILRIELISFDLSRC